METDISYKNMRNMNRNHRKMWAMHKLSVSHLKTNSILPQQVKPNEMAFSIGTMYTLVCTLPMAQINVYMPNYKPIYVKTPHSYIQTTCMHNLKLRRRPVPV